MSRLLQILWLVLLACPAQLAALELIDGPHVEVEANRATVRWKTSGVSGSRVRYGSDTVEWQTRAGEGVSADHRVMLDGLKPGVTYRFTVGTARRVLKEGSFTTPPQSGTAAAPASRSGPRAPPKPAADNPTYKPPLKVPPLRQIWGDLDSLQDHFERHGQDFRASSAENYAQQAWRFLQRAIDEELPAKLDNTDGTVRVYDPKTRAFAAYRRDGRARTYFKPDSPSYFDRQPGNPVRLKRSTR